jgi:hypothetical protein
MSKKLLSAIIVAALICTTVGARGLVRANEPVKEPARESLRAEISKLIAEAKAGGRGVAVPRLQLQTSKGNNLSKNAKIAIGVGIAAAVAVVVLVVVNKRCENEPGGC